MEVRDLQSAINEIASGQALVTVRLPDGRRLDVKGWDFENEPDGLGIAVLIIDAE